MGMQKNIFGISNVGDSKNNVGVKMWLSVLLIVEKVSEILCIYNCTMQIVQGNMVQVRIQDWHDEFIMRFGKEYGLEEYFYLETVTGYNDMYISILKPKINGNARQFMSELMNELESQYHLGYEFDSRYQSFSKEFR